MTRGVFAGARTPPTMKPAFTRHGVVVTTDDGLVVDLGDRLVRLGGTAAMPLLLALIPLMDGTRSVEELERAVSNVPTEHVRRAIAALSQHGLVERRRSEQSPGPNDRYYRLYQFLDQMASRLSPEAPGAFQAIRASAVGIVADRDEASVAQLRDVLRMCGLGQVNHVPLAALARRDAPVTNQTLLVSLAVDGESYARSCQIDDVARGVRVPWLRAAIDSADEHFDIGPFFDPAESPCYRCFYRQHLERNAKGVRKRLRSSAADVAALVSLIAMEIVGLLGHVGVTIGDQSFRRVKLADLQSVELRYIGLPGCERCSPVRHMTESELGGAGLTVASTYENAVGTRSGRDVARKLAREPQNTTEIPPKSLPALPQCALPAPRPLSRSTATSLEVAERKGRWDVEALATVLRLGVGIRDDGAGALKRWVSTSGNLGSPEAYVVARRVDGLEAGVYCFQSAAHTLARLGSRKGAPIVDEVLAGLYDHSATRADALIVLTGAFHRLSWKYGPFAYRLMQFDAGVALSQIQSIATNLDLLAKPTDKWFDDAVESALDLDGVEEQVTTVIVLSSHDETVRATTVCPEGLDINRALVGEFERGPMFARLAPVQLLQSLIVDSRQLARNGPPPIFESVALTASEEVVGLAVPLPAGTGLTMPLGRVLERRRSVRQYADRGVNATDLAAMLSNTHAVDEDDWFSDIRAGMVLRLTVVARNVVGLEAGVYRYVAAGQSLKQVNTELSASELSALFAQQDVSAAAAQVWIGGSLAACATRGSRAYRRMLIRAGAVAHRISVAAVASGVSGAIVAGIVANAARRSLGFDGWHHVPLLAFTCGHEVLSNGSLPIAGD